MRMVCVGDTIYPLGVLGIKFFRCMFGRQIRFKKFFSMKGIQIIRV
jgi:hypothetical protein